MSAFELTGNDSLEYPAPRLKIYLNGCLSGDEGLTEARTGKNPRHLLVGLLRQSVFGRLAGYEDVNDAERLCRDPAMRWAVGGGAPTGQPASASQMGAFETEWPNPIVACLTEPEDCVQSGYPENMQTGDSSRRRP